MAATYEIWETRSNNVVCTYVTEGAALAAVSTQVKRYGRDAVESGTLLRETEDEEVAFLAGSHELADRGPRYSAVQMATASA